MAYLRYGDGSRWYVYSPDNETLLVHFEERDCEEFSLSRAISFVKSPDWEIFATSSLKQEDMDMLLHAMRAFLKRNGYDAV